MCHMERGEQLNPGHLAQLQKQATKVRLVDMHTQYSEGSSQHSYLHQLWEAWIRFLFGSHHYRMTPQIAFPREKTWSFVLCQRELEQGGAISPTSLNSWCQWTLEVVAKGFNSLQRFSFLTNAKYPQLFQVLDSILKVEKFASNICTYKVNLL
jgi:hypothetical protein